MPFPKVNELKPNPSVRVFFGGQLILEPSDDAKTCEVFVNRSAPDHHLSIEVRRKRPGNKPDVIVMRHLGPLAFVDVSATEPRKHGLLISLANATPEGVRMYDGRISSPEGWSLSHALDMKTIHTVDVGAVDLLGGRPSVLLDDAIFYTADLTPDDLKVELKKKKAGSQPVRLPPFANIIGANIYLPPPSDPEKPPHVTLTWSQLGSNTNLPLERLPDGHSYEIYICNDPLFEATSFDIPTHKEFAEYYKILPAVPHDEQFEMEFPDLESLSLPSGRRGSTTTPCMPVIK